MATAATELLVDGVAFPATVKPLGSSETLILGGAGVRGLQIRDNFVKFTAIGVYVQKSAIGVLAAKWKGKTADELASFVDFFRDIVTGPFEKFTRVTMILPLTGLQYADKVTENCVAFWKSVGIYTDAEAKAVEQFKQVLNDQIFPPGSSILFTQSPSGELTIGFSKDGSIPAAAAATIANKNLSEAILESIIGEHGVSPEAKRSLASRLCQFWINETETKEELELPKMNAGGTPVVVNE